MNQSSDTIDREIEASVGSQSLTPATIGRFLIGDRKAIQQVANCPHAVRVGFVFVISAGFAREYDGESLLHEPWHLLLPLGASLVTSFVLFLMVSLVAWRRGVNTIRVRETYPMFLGLFWMTAPLAWLYAIPVEQFMSPGNATAANLWFLGIVALWRVVLMIRVITVIFGAGTLSNVICTVLLFSDVVMLIAVFAMPTPIWSVMGGIHYTESERHILGLSLWLKFWGLLSLPIWLIGYALACRKQPAWNPVFGQGATPVNITRSLWGLAIASLLFWIPVLPVTQPEQFLRFQVDRSLAVGRIEDALRQMSNHERADFPPHWDPLPRPGYRENSPSLYSIIESIANNEECRPWVRQLYVNKFMWNLNQRQLGYLNPNGEFDDLENFIELLERIPEGRRAFAKDFRNDALRLSEDSEMPPSLRERIRVLTGLPDSPDNEQSTPAISGP